MNEAALVERLARTPAALTALLGPMGREEFAWKPSDGAWSILEIVRHLGDEEVEDFRARLRSTLRDPAAPWAPIDPEGAARERRYVATMLILSAPARNDCKPARESIHDVYKFS